MIIDKNFSLIMEYAFENRTFQREELLALVRAMLEGTLSDIRIAAAMTALRGVTLNSGDILAVVNVIMEKHPTTKLPTIDYLVDCGGTGCYGSHTFNISTTAGFIAAAAGAKVAKFAGRSLSHKSGSSGILKILGVPSAKTKDEALTHLERYRLTFLNAMSFYPSLRDLGEIRKTLGFITLIDILFPLMNPMPLFGQLIGVYHSDVMPLISQTLKQLGRQRGLVVHAKDGLDEFSVCSPTFLHVLEHNQIREMSVAPQDFGFEPFALDDLQCFRPEDNAHMIELVLENKAPKAIQWAAEINAAGILWCAAKVDSIAAGLALAKATVQSGQGAALLSKCQQK